jgi:hypothetical protein
MFTLKIKLGNDAMQTGADVAEALREVADYVESSARGAGLSCLCGAPLKNARAACPKGCR